MGKYDVIIIGSGLGSLLCGTILSREGYNVCLLEKNHKPGGSLQTFGRKGCVFNTGLNYTESLDEGQVLNQYFRYFGLMDRLTFTRLDEDGFEIISFPDAQYRIAMGESNFVETLARDFPGERAALQEYHSRIREICEGISLYSLRDDQLSIAENYNLSGGAADYIKSVISDQRLRNVLAGNSLLYAGHETKTPLLIHALINHSFIESAWRLNGGSHQLVNALTATIRANGGTILTDAKVTELAGQEDIIRGATLENGEFIEGKYFIAGIHPCHILDIVEPGMFRKAFGTRINGLENTMGMFTLYIVFKKNTVPYRNNNFYHFNQDNTWIPSDYQLSKWPQNYLYMTTASTSSSQFAASGSVITYMDFSELSQWEHTFTGHRGEDYLAFKQAKAEKLLDSVEMQFPGIRDQIDSMYTSTPLTWRDYTGTRAGSAYGILKDYNRPLESMILPRTKIRNLFLTGQNTNIHGILGVTISSVVTCGELIDIRYLVKKIRQS